MNRLKWIIILGAVLVSAPLSQAQYYIGFAYPAGGQQGATVRIKLGGQRLAGLEGAVISGAGVKAKLVQYYRNLSNQEMSLIREQQRELKRIREKDEATQKMIDLIDKRVGAWVNRPANRSISELAFFDVTIAPDAKPGKREIRLVTSRGVSNPLAFHVGQFPEVTRKAMKTATMQVLGKEHLAQRKRPADEEEVSITIPCTMNGQIASGEVNRYRFTAKKGQRLVIATAARQLIPYIADAVPGWFQPVLTLHDAEGKEVAYNDDYRFSPDPTLRFDVPKDGEYVLSITDAIFRGREDFVYRITLSEMPFVTGVFPLGRRAGAPSKLAMNGWNLNGAKLTPPATNAKPGVHMIAAKKGKVVSNPVPFAIGTLPECFDQEPNNDPSKAQKVKLPIIVNGRVDRPGDWDVFRVDGRAGETIVAEVNARRLDSPVDSFLKVTDANGKLLAFNDDRQDAGSGLNTHHADSYLMLKLPADGPCFVHIGETSHTGGKEYAYRLRISAPRPDFALRVVPSSINLRGKKSGSVNVYAIRKDGYTGPINLRLKDGADGFAARPVVLKANQEKTRISVSTTHKETRKPISLAIEGVLKQNETIAREAVPADDRMQAFLWRHLVPADEFKALVYDSSRQPIPKRVAPLPPEKTNTTTTAEKPKAKFSKRQVASRLRQLKGLYEEWLITDEFYLKKVAECEAAL